MIVPTDQGELERLVKRTRKTLAVTATQDDSHVGPMSRIAGACYPDFIAAFGAELRAGTFPPYVESAVFTLLTNMLLTLAHTAAANPDGTTDRARLKEAADAYMQTFINAFAEKARLLAGAEVEEAAHTIEAPALTQ